jgi:hypothetical protein
MRKLLCHGPGCADRRIHHERQDVPRGPQWVNVPDDFKGQVAYCSLTCAAMDHRLTPYREKT